jgi:AraC-like DNA-binding protein
MVNKIHKEYNTTELIHENETIKAQFTKQRKHSFFFTGGTVLLGITLSLVTFRYLRNKRIYEQKFKDLLTKTHNINNLRPKIKSEKDKTIDINLEKLCNKILHLLEKLERDQKFLQKNLTLPELAVRFKCNPRYLSLVIAHSRNKTFTKYINDLKVDYLINLFKTDKIIRNYNNSALAEEAGFSTTQRFTTAFLSRTNMSPINFIGQLKMEKE